MGTAVTPGEERRRGWGPDSGAQGSGVQQRPEQKTFLLAPGQEGTAGTPLGSRGLRPCFQLGGPGVDPWLGNEDPACLSEQQIKKKEGSTNEGLWEIKADSREHPVRSPAVPSSTRPLRHLGSVSVCQAPTMCGQCAGSQQGARPWTRQESPASVLVGLMRHRKASKSESPAVKKAQKRGREEWEAGWVTEEGLSGAGSEAR